jgi:hypothetical protein
MPHDLVDAHVVYIGSLKFLRGKAFLCEGFFATGGCAGKHTYGVLFGSLRSRRYEVLDGWTIRMGNKKRGSRRNPKMLKCRDCGYEPKVKMVRRDCKECGGFMRVKR